MLNFELYNPTNLIFGKGQMAKLASLVPKSYWLMVVEAFSKMVFTTR
jgi:alcohol dehydrogenase YqhD (iron-dependent ADH family)